MENIAPVVGWFGGWSQQGQQCHSQGTFKSEVSSVNNLRQMASSHREVGKGDIKQTASSFGTDITNRNQPGAGTTGRSDNNQSLNSWQFEPSLIDGASFGDSAGRGRRDWDDIDKQNEDDPQACSAYAPAIFVYLREAELQRRPNSRYLDLQSDVNAKMRAILVDWLVEVAEEYKLCADTLYQAVNYVDRFLSLHVAQRSQLQLIGVTCMWIAAKYEEIYPPNVSDFCYITDNTYTRQQMIAMEELVLKTLSYELCIPTPKIFLRRLLQVCNPDEHLHFLSNYLTELALLDYNMLNFLPSVVAASGVFLANAMLKRQAWNGNLRHFSAYVPKDLATCVAALANVHSSVNNAGQSQLGAIRDKYNHVRFQEIAKVPGITISPYLFE